MKFVRINPGYFYMGGTDDESDILDEMYYHKVVMTKVFFAQTKEVTIGQWKKFAEETGYSTQAEKDGYSWVASKKYPGFIKKKNYCWRQTGYIINDNFPVTFITWEDTQNFIKWLNEKGKYKYRLPTEAEWERVCRAGMHTNYSNGQIGRYDLVEDKEIVKKLDEISWYRFNSDDHPMEVGKKEPNSWGLYDVHGNISEFCQDYFSLRIPESTETDPVVKEKFGLFGIVVRGGSFYSHQRFNKSYSRDFEKKNIANNLRGFRLILEIPKES